jgi:hypothetical protein
MERPTSPADYEQRIDQFANDERARDLLKMVHAVAGAYFAYLDYRGVQVGSLMIHRNVPTNEPMIHKRISEADLYRGGNLVSEH